MSEIREVESSPWPKATYAWYVVLILSLAQTVSFVDRMILSLLVAPIKATLDISDTQISLLHGFSFAIFYALMGIPIARMADEKNRRNIIAIGIFFWSLMTALCGLAQNFWHLFLARVGVGIGEAALSPAGFSLISDYFPPEKRARAMSIFTMGIYIGSGIAFIIGGAVIKLVMGGEPLEVPVLGTLHPWQLTFVAVGLPGVFLAALMFTVREPLRKGMLVRGNETSNSVPLSVVVRYLGHNWRTYTGIILGYSLTALINFAGTAWIPTFFIRTHGWSASEIGYVYGLIILVFGTLGVISGGWLADRLVSKGYRDGNLLAMMVGGFGVIIPGVLYPLVADSTWAVVLLAPYAFFVSFPTGASVAALQTVTPNSMRAQATAVYLFIVSFISLGFGPTAVALITDFAFGQDGALRYSLAIVTALAAPAALLVVAFGRRNIKATMSYQQTWTESKGAVAT
ncbi:spinster family MFS transporter [Metapseudomonas furukawaii]